MTRRGSASSEEVSSSASSSLLEEMSPSQEKRSSSLSSSNSPSTRNWRLSSPSVKDSSSSDSTAEFQSRSSHHRGARASYAVLGSTPVSTHRRRKIGRREPKSRRKRR